MNHGTPLRTFKLTFPSTYHVQCGAFNRQAIIKALRMLAPSLGLKETKDLTFESDPQLVMLGYKGMNSSNYFDAMDTLAENGVVIEPCDGAEPESRVKSVLAPESIAADIRLIVVGALKRKEYDTVAELIKVLKDLDNI